MKLSYLIKDSAPSFVCGERPPLPSGVIHLRLSAVAARGITATAGNDCPGADRKSFCLLLGKKFCGMYISPLDWRRRLWLFSAPGDGAETIWHGTGGRGDEGPRNNAIRRWPYIPASFAGMPGAQATARQRRRDRSGRCKPGVFTHRTVAAARNRASGFGGDWRVRQQLPVGVGPDDRMPPGSREPKVRVRQEVA
ncbi:Uncharacterised protein [Escherichia coli]|nr:Uncharacterised protein [Escherichia coli]SQP07589.1 Uncharacterised protein [Escherichia coli]